MRGRLRTYTATAVVLGAAAMMTVAFAAQGGPDEPPKVPGTQAPATSTPSIPVSFLGIEEGRERYLSGEPLASLDRAILASNVDAIINAWTTTTTKCVVESERTGDICAGLPGPAGSEHTVEVFRFGLDSAPLAISRARSSLHTLLDGNTVRLVLIAKSAKDDLVLIYSFDERSLGATYPEDHLMIRVNGADPLHPIVSLAFGTAAINPMLSLARNPNMESSLADIVALDPALGDLPRQP